MTDLKEIATANVINVLNSRAAWPAWFKDLKFHAQIRRIWYLIDSDATDALHIDDEHPMDPLIIDMMISRINIERSQAYDA